jgi:hypothetical protein
MPEGLGAGVLTQRVVLGYGVGGEPASVAQRVGAQGKVGAGAGDVAQRVQACGGVERVCSAA